MNLPGNERAIVTATHWIDECDRAALKARSWPPGTVIFPKVGAAMLTEKRRTLAVEACFDNNIMGLVAHEVILPLYLLAVMEQIRLANAAQKGAVPSVNQRVVGDIELLLPPLAEQRRIVDLIGAVDRGIAATRELCTIAGRTLSSYLDEHLSSWQGAFATAPLGQLVEMGSGPSWKAADESPVPTAGGLRVLGITNTPPSGEVDMAREVYVAGLSERTRRLEPHSLLMIRTNGNRGRIGNVYRVTPDAVGAAYSAFQIGVFPHDPEVSSFIYWFLSAPSTQRSISDAASGTTGLGNIAVRWLRELPVPCLSSDACEAFVATAERIDEVKRAAARQAGTLTLLRSALLSDLLSGEHEIPESYDELLERAS